MTLKVRDISFTQLRIAPKKIDASYVNMQSFAPAILTEGIAETLEERSNFFTSLNILISEIHQYSNQKKYQACETFEFSYFVREKAEVFNLHILYIY